MMASMPRWAKIVLVIVGVWFLVMAVLFFLGTLTGTSNAATTNCPYYVAVGDPNTGGTEMVDACNNTYSAVATTTSSDSDATTAVASSAYGHCRTVRHKVSKKNAVGWVLIWVKLEKYWCWKNSKITYHPTTKFTHGVTAAGSALQYDDCCLVDKNTYNPPGAWESYSWGVEKFKQQVCVLSACVILHDYNVESDIHAYGDGHYTW